MLILTEIAEAVQADREGKRADADSFKVRINDNTDDDIFKYAYAYCISSTLEDELADIVIQCLDLAELRGIDLTHALDDIDKLSMTAFDEWEFTGMAYCMCSQVVTGNAEAVVLSTIDFVFHYCKAKGIDIEWFIAQKMKYNKLRPYKHGDKKY